MVLLGSDKGDSRMNWIEERKMISDMQMSKALCWQTREQNFRNRLCGEKRPSDFPPIFFFILMLNKLKNEFFFSLWLSFKNLL